MKILISFLLLLCCISTSSSSPVSISGGIFTSIGRNLLQAKTPCSVDFEHMNYTIITSRCKAPQYTPKSCCDAFKDFACPYSDKINDLKSNCSEDMFDHINFNGKYPDSLFANLCRDNKMGLICPAIAPGTEGNNINTEFSNSPDIYSSSISRLTMGFIIIIFLFMWI